MNRSPFYLFFTPALQMHRPAKSRNCTGRRPAAPFTVSMIFALLSTVLQETAYLWNDILSKREIKGLL